MSANIEERIAPNAGAELDLNQNSWRPSLKIRPHHLTDPEMKGSVIGKRIIAFNWGGIKSIGRIS